jgi:hypothetical protein
VSVVKAVKWDWKEEPDLEAIAKAVTEVSGGTVHLREVDTGDPFYVWLISDHELTDAAADEALTEVLES